MHVLHVIDSLGLGGAERMLVDIANATVANGHRVSVCVTRADVTLAPELSPRIELVVLDRRRTVDPRATLALIRWIRNHEVDVLHVHMRSSARFMCALEMVGLVKTPMVFHDHYGTIEIDTRVPLWFRMGRHRIRHYVGVYDKLRAWAISGGMPSSRASTIPNSLAFARITQRAPTDLRARWSVPSGHLLGIHVATVRRDKALELVIEAAARARNRARIQILVVGTFPDAEYKAECLALRDRLRAPVEFVGGRTDVPAVLRGADFAVLSSKTESGPLVLVEYLAAELPIVSTRVGDIGQRLAAAGVEGFVEPGDLTGFVTALDAAVELSPDERLARIARGSAAIEGWDIGVVMPRWYAVYEQAIAS